MNVPLFFLIVLYPLDLIAFLLLLQSLKKSTHEKYGSNLVIPVIIWLSTGCLIFTAAIIAIHCR